MNPFIKRMALPCLLAGLLSTAAAEPLTFGRALDLAQRQSPLLQASDASIRAAQFEVAASGHLPDPKLTIGVDNYPVSGPMRGSLEGDFMTMQKVGFMQEVPNSAKRAAQVQAAAANVDTSEAAQRITQWRVRLATAQAWLNRFYLERKLDALDGLAGENASLASVLNAQIASGRSEAVESIEQRQEIARLEDQRDDLRRDVAKATAALRQVIGLGAQDPLAGAAPDMPIDAGRLRDRMERHPELQAIAAAHAAADADVNTAKAEKRPDWGVEVSYARRGPQFGNMVSIQFTVGLPLFAGTRQDPIIKSKAMQRSRVAAEHEAMRLDRAGELDADLAVREALLHQLQRSQNQSVFLAEQRVALLTSAYGAAKANLAAVYAARRDLRNERLRVIDLQSQLDAITAKLYFTFEAGAQ
jgi:cobalt-zinc-cadmium efflux system outer membrane protein